MAGNDWAQPAPDMLATAKDRAMAALNSPEAARKLLRYYDTTTDYAGASFATIGENAPDRIGADDLFATTLLSVAIPANAARRLTEDTETTDAIAAALKGLPSGPLETVDATGLAAMEVLYRHVKKNLAKAKVKTSNPWVIASKLCARKRPDLFPVRDNIVCRLLDIQRASNYRVDWLVYQSLIGDDEVKGAIEQLRASVQESASDAVVLDSEPLRLLDAALWTSVQMS